MGDILIPLRAFIRTALLVVALIWALAAVAGAQPLVISPEALQVPLVQPVVAYYCPSGYTMTHPSDNVWAYICDPFDNHVLNGLTAAYFLAVGADVDLTVRLLQQRRGREMNWAMKPLAATPGGFGLKVALNAGLAMATYRWVPKHRRLRIMAILAAMNVAVAAWNGSVYATARRKAGS